MLKIDGGCHCEKIAFKAVVDPEKTRICHCSDCQILSGSAFRVNVPVAKANFELTGGTLKTYIKIAESGERRSQCFCADCGTQIYATSAEKRNDPILNLRVGTIRQKQELMPRSQQWTRSALKWTSKLNFNENSEKQSEIPQE